MEIAAYREKWREIVGAAMSLNGLE